ncbi:MAG TPA: pitrilysin family protein, partial [Terriglobia bacterium]|nr:pitrilysin family protein [Terriglobia bacterium]
MDPSPKRLHIPVEHTTLANGLRVVASPDRTAPVVTVGVYYQIGFRLEPRGRSGFAHLFEHMMFQGSENAGKMEHIRLINSSGGVLNGTTNYDVTNYFEAVPSNALERVLWLEADRMRALKVDDENLRNQRDVVKEEVRVNVMNQPYGGFPWLDLPPVAFRNWPNAHNFYGDFADLDAATLADVQNFFRTYYAPNNAVLVMLGDFEPSEAFALAKRYFDDIPAAPLPAHTDVSEPPQTEERHGEVTEKFGPLPAIAIGYTLPPRESADWYAAGLIEPVLHGGRAGRVYRKLVLEEQIAVDADGSADLFATNGPTQIVTRIFHKPEFTSEGTVAIYDEVIG